LKLAKVSKVPAWPANSERDESGRLSLRSGGAGLGGHLDIVARIGNIHLNIA